MSITTGAPQSAQNYLVPSSGGTHFVPVSGVFGGTPFVVDFRQFTIDQFPFSPQGVFIDNSQGTGDLQITVQPGGWVIDCPAGARLSTSYPAPQGQVCSITGNGQATVIFVDFPVLPNAGAVTVIGTVNADIVGPNPLPVSAPANVGGVPYQVTVEPIPLVNHQGIINGALVSYDTGALPAGTNLYKIYLNILAQSTLGAAAELTVTVTLNGVQIWQGFPLIPSVVSTTSGMGIIDKEISFPGEAAMPTGGGHLVVAISAAFATGALVVNAYVG